MQVNIDEKNVETTFGDIPENDFFWFLGNLYLKPALSCTLNMLHNYRLAIDFSTDRLTSFCNSTTVISEPRPMQVCLAK